MEKTIEELILQELREIKGAVNGLDYRVKTMGNRIEAMDQRIEAMDQRMEAMENRIEAMEKCMDSRLTALENRLVVIEKKVVEMAESLDEVRTATNSLLDWAERVYAHEYVHDPNFPRIGGVGVFDVRNNAVGEENARYFVESNGKRTYY